MAVSSDLLSGDYAANKARIQDAYDKAIAALNTRRGKLLNEYGYKEDGVLDEQNKYGRYQQLQYNYTSARDSLNANKNQYANRYGIKIGEDGKSWQDDPNDNMGEFDRLQTDRTDSLKRISDARNRLQFLSGMRANFDAEGMPTDLRVSQENPMGHFQRLLGDQARSLSATSDAVRGRGLGGKGLAQKLIGQAEAGASGERFDFRQGLIDSLIGSRLQEKDTETGFARKEKDMRADIDSALDKFLREGKDMDYRKGVDETNLANSLAEALFGIDQERYGATTSYNNALQDALMQALMDKINSGQAGAGSTGGDQTSAAAAGATTATAGGPEPLEWFDPRTGKSVGVMNDREALARSVLYGGRLMA